MGIEGLVDTRTNHFNTLLRVSITSETPGQRPFSPSTIASGFHGPVRLVSVTPTMVICFAPTAAAMWLTPESFAITISARFAIAAKFPNVVGGNIVASGHAALANASSRRDGKTIGSIPLSRRGLTRSLKCSQCYTLP